MASSYPKLPPVDAGKNVVFDSPLISTNRKFVRTGVLNKENSLLEACIRSMNTRAHQLSNAEMFKEIENLKKRIFANIKYNSWIKSDSKNSYDAIRNNLPKIWKEWSAKVVADQNPGKYSNGALWALLNNEDKKKLWKVIVGLLPTDKAFIKYILPASKSRYGAEMVNEFKKQIIRSARKYVFKKLEGESITEDKKKRIHNGVKTSISAAMEEAEKLGYFNYIRSLEKNSELADTYYYGKLSEQLNRDIYILDASHRLPLNNMIQSSDYRGRKSIILLKTSNYTFETVGQIDENKKIMRDFLPNSDTILKIKYFILEPDKLKYNYPDIYKIREKHKKVDELYDSENDSDDYF